MQSKVNKNYLVVNNKEDVIVEMSRVKVVSRLSVSLVLEAVAELGGTSRCPGPPYGMD
jgi:hypothetical protein